MSEPNLEQAYTELWEWCRARNFAGHDPFDALNSRLLQATPLKQSRTARLAWTQFFKRSPINFRSLARVPAERNAKGMALFALAALADARRSPSEENLSLARGLLSELLTLRLPGSSGAAWGYNFDWQSRVLFAGRGTPTIVPTAFAGRALIEGHRLFGDDDYLRVVREVQNFIIKDLPRTVETEEEICFSYSPQSDTRVVNASLLAAEVLSTGEDQAVINLAIRATRYVCRQQRPDGAWYYGADPTQNWVDNFHTAFVLGSLVRISEQLEKHDKSFASDLGGAIARGYDYWRRRFFLADGWPKYYDDSHFPADTHAAATAIATLCDLKGQFPEALSLANKVAAWAIKNLRNPDGSFAYQRRRFFVVRTPFMRWSEAWMLYGMARLLEESAAESTS